MEEQGALPFPPGRPTPTEEKVRRETAAAREESLEARFQAFHAAHPEVYEELARLAREAMSGGARQLGIGMLWEVLRWNRLFKVAHGTTDFKLNNSYRSRYARILMEREADLRGVFETRELLSEAA